MRFVTLDQAAPVFSGKRVAIVGGGPSALDSSRGFIDSHDVVVRVNNYRMRGYEDRVGSRTDVYYSYYGGAIKKTAQELREDGVRLCMCKCPNSKPIESAWHERHAKQMGIDFRWIYEMRRDFWFCDTVVPTTERFLSLYNLLDRHIPTTGFSAIWDVLECRPATVSLVGFDLFASGLHNLNEKWRPGDPNDPIGHRPDWEARQIAVLARRHVMVLDPALSRVVSQYAEAA